MGTCEDKPDGVAKTMIIIASVSLVIGLGICFTCSRCRRKSVTQRRALRQPESQIQMERQDSATAQRPEESQIPAFPQQTEIFRARPEESQIPAFPQQTGVFRAVTAPTQVPTATNVRIMEMKPMQVPVA